MKRFDIHAHMGKTSSGEAIGVEQLISDMDKYGILRTGISSLSGIDNREQNDLVYDSYLKYPDRIIPYAFINPKSKDAIKELDLCLGERGFLGVKFHPWKHGYFADNTPQIDEILTQIENYGVHIQIYPGTSPLCTP